MKRKQILLALYIFLALLTLTLLSVPRVRSIETVDFAKISNYPVLEKAYNELCTEYSLYEIVPQKNIQIVTVKNLWGSWKRYILPCFAAKTPDVPRAGNADFTAFMYILSPWEKENLFIALCPLKLQRFSVQMQTGENVMAYQLAEVVPGGARVDTDRFGKDVVLQLKQNCDKEPGVFVYYTMATLNSARQPDQGVTTQFSWSYYLRLGGCEFEKGTFSLIKEHTVNA